MTDAGDLADREWRLIREAALDGPTAMAFDEIAAETAARGGPRTVRVYRWRPSTLSLGYRQDPDTVAWEYCHENGIDVTRRPTGGGGIYHDTRGDISYSIVAPADELPGDLLESYARLCEPILDALRELGVDAGYAEAEQPALYRPSCYLRAVHPAHDVVAGDGRKISGNAQYRRRDAVIQHGSLTFETTPETSLACFAEPGVTPDQYRERVTSIREQRDRLDGPDPDGPRGGQRPIRELDRDKAVETLEQSLASWAGAAAGTWTDEERKRAADRADEKYDSDVWNLERDDPTG